MIKMTDIKHVRYLLFLTESKGRESRFDCGVCSRMRSGAETRKKVE